MPHLLAAALGCGAPEPEPAPAPAPDDAIVPSPWTLPATSTGEPPIDPAQLGRALDAAIVEILAYDAAPVIDGYLSIWETSAEPACPAATLDPYGNVYWADGCTATDGTTFGGYLSQYVTTDLYDDDAGVWLDGVELAGNVALTGPAGTYDFEGFAARYTGASDDGSITLVQSVAVGGFAWDGAAATGWLRDAGLAGASVEVTLIDYDLAGLGSAARQVHRCRQAVRMVTAKGALELVAGPLGEIQRPLEVPPCAGGGRKIGDADQSVWMRRADIPLVGRGHLLHLLHGPVQGPDRQQVG